MTQILKPTILITGASKGLGAEIAEHYLNQGHKVVSLSRSASVVHENHLQYQADISIEADILYVIKDLKSKKIPIDVLINNAGIASMNFMVSTPLTTAASIFNTNVLGTFLVTREISKMMILQKAGRIINISSVSLPLHLEWQSIYASSKAALEEFTRIIAKELAPFNVTANILGPNPMAADLIHGIPESNLNKVLERQSIKKMGMPSDVIHCLDFFMSEKSTAITGQTIYLNGVF